MVAGIFLLSGIWFFLFVAFFITWAAFEYVAMVRPRAPHAPLSMLVVLVPVAALAMSLAPAPFASSGIDGGVPQQGLLLGTLVSVGLGALVLFSRTPLEETMESLGILGFGLPYFAVPIASVYRLQQADPWLVFLLLTIVWLGDTAAFFVGSRYGRHRMAPMISPKKSWEGAGAGFVTGLAVAAVWSVFRLGRLDPGLLAVAAVTAAAAQVGDLVESMIKRAVGVKDSGSVLPGHGGVLDRCDAVLFAAPVLLIGAWLLPASVLR